MGTKIDSLRSQLEEWFDLRTAAAVLEWDQHGVDCAVCIDVATRSRQLHASGASVRDIRATVEREYKPLSPRMTPTPPPPGTSASAEHVH